MGNRNPRRGGRAAVFCELGDCIISCYGASRGFWQANIQITLVLSRFSLPSNN